MLTVNLIINSLKGKTTNKDFFTSLPTALICDFGVTALVWHNLNLI